MARGSTMHDVDIRLDGVDGVLAALAGIQPQLRDATVPVMEAGARRTAASAAARVRTDRTHNLWSGARGRRLHPRYHVERPGEYWFRVVTPGGKAGKAEAIAEFARLPVTEQGAALVRSLSSVYGRGGGSQGRILWAQADAEGEAIRAQVQAAVEAAASAASGEMGG